MQERKKKNPVNAGLEKLAQPAGGQLGRKYKTKKRGKKIKQWGFVVLLGNHRFKGESVILQPHSFA